MVDDIDLFDFAEVGQELGGLGLCELNVDAFLKFALQIQDEGALEPLHCESVVNDPVVLVFCQKRPRIRELRGTS